jgi:hypothetical protein
MVEKVLKKLNLEKNLHITLYDRSKKLIGDRYQVILVAEMEIPITQFLLENENQISIEIKEFTKVLGDKVVFQQKREKIFVDEKEKEGLLNTMTDSFISDIIPYLSRPDFPVKFIKKQYKDKLIEQSRLKRA